MCRVLLIDSDTVIRFGWREVVKGIEPELAVTEADTFVEAISVLRERNDIALIILDLAAQDCGGFVGLFQLRNEFPHIPVVMLSSDPKTDMAGCAAAFGAAGIIPESPACDALQQSFKTVLGGQAGPLPVISNAIHCNSAVESLSPALLRVLMGVRRGLRNKEIAFELGLSEKTIKAYLGILYRKLGVSNRTQAVIFLQEALAEREFAQAAGPVAANIG